MKIIEVNNEILKEKFLHFFAEIYPASFKVDYSISTHRNLLSSTPSTNLFLLIDKNKNVLGRMLLGQNPQLIDQNGMPYGYIGMFEVKEKFTFFKLMLNFATDWLNRKGSELTLFPFIGSTWQQYRFTTKQSENFSFFQEPLCKSYYHEFAKQYGVAEKYFYKSSLRKDINIMKAEVTSDYKNVLKQGFVLRDFNKKNTMQEMKILYNLSIEGFNNNLFYCKISFNEFIDIYGAALKILDPEFVTIVETPAGKPVGFLYSLLDYTPILEKEGDFSKIFQSNDVKKQVNGVIYKTTCVLPEFRGKGLMSACVYHHCDVALKRHYDYVIAAFQYEKNKSLKVISRADYENIYELYVLKNSRRQ